MSITRDIEERYRCVECTWISQDAEQVFAVLYTEDVCIQDSVSKSNAHGKLAAVAVIERLMLGVDSVALATQRILEVNAEFALTQTRWVLYSESAHFPGIEMMCQSLWKKTPQGWRISADMQAGGAYFT